MRNSKVSFKNLTKVNYRCKLIVLVNLLNINKMRHLVSYFSVIRPISDMSTYAPVHNNNKNLCDLQ